MIALVLKSISRNAPLRLTLEFVLTYRQLFVLALTSTIISLRLYNNFSIVHIYR